MRQRQRNSEQDTVGAEPVAARSQKPPALNRALQQGDDRVTRDLERFCVRLRDQKRPLPPYGHLPPLRRGREESARCETRILPLRSGEGKNQVVARRESFPCAAGEGKNQVVARRESFPCAAGEGKNQVVARRESFPCAAGEGKNQVVARRESFPAQRGKGKSGRCETRILPLRSGGRERSGRCEARILPLRSGGRWRQPEGGAPDFVFIKIENARAMRIPASRAARRSAPIRAIAAALSTMRHSVRAGRAIAHDCRARRCGRGRARGFHRHRRSSTGDAR